jgi:endonuclease/exonuclease/phosphatase family metal-dependent hydrolase
VKSSVCSYVIFILFYTLSCAFASDAITIDGQFDDWENIPVLASDPAGDNIVEDFAELKITNDNDFIFFFFSFYNGDQLLQDSNHVTLYIDSDNNSASGILLNGIGADLEWDFGPRLGFVHSDSGSTPFYQNDITLRRGPNVSAEKIEIAIARSSWVFTANGRQLADTISVVFKESDPLGDYLPDNGHFVSYTIDHTNIPPPEPILLQKEDANDIRLLTYNVQNHLWNVFENKEMHARLEGVLKAIDPDIIALQHVHSDSTVDSLIHTWFPGNDWYRMGNYGPPGIYDPESDKIIFSKFPIITREFWFIESKRMYGCLLDTREKLGTDLLIVNTHLPAYSIYDKYRQSDADNFVKSMRELQSGNGLFYIEDQTPFVVLGDFNMYGKGRVLRTLVSGDIWDEATFGSDYAADWDSSPLTDLISRHTHIRMSYTWRQDASEFAPSRIDLILYSNSVIDIANHFILNTLAIPDADLISYDLDKYDTDTISRHLPHVMDIRSVHTVGFKDKNGPEAAKIFVLYPAYPNPFNASTVISYQIASASTVILKVYDISGKYIRTLVSEKQKPGKHSFHFDGSNLASGIYFCQLQAGSFSQSRKIILLK